MEIENKNLLLKPQNDHEISQIYKIAHKGFYKYLQRRAQSWRMSNPTSKNVEAFVWVRWTIKKVRLVLKHEHSSIFRLTKLMQPFDKYSSSGFLWGGRNFFLISTFLPPTQKHSSKAMKNVWSHKLFHVSNGCKLSPEVSKPSFSNKFHFPELFSSVAHRDGFEFHISLLLAQCGANERPGNFIFDALGVIWKRKHQKIFSLGVVQKWDQIKLFFFCNVQNETKIN